MTSLLIITSTFLGGLVYIADMIQLPDNYPDVYQEFLNGKHAVSRSKSKSGFNSVATDMALEQSFNRDFKMKGKNLFCT